MELHFDNITFRRDINRPAAWKVWVNGNFIGDFHTDALARVLRHTRQR